MIERERTQCPRIHEDLIERNERVSRSMWSA